MIKKQSIFKLKIWSTLSIIFFFLVGIQNLQCQELIKTGGLADRDIHVLVTEIVTKNYIATTANKSPVDTSWALCGSLIETFNTNGNLTGARYEESPQNKEACQRFANIGYDLTYEITAMPEFDDASGYNFDMLFQWTEKVGYKEALPMEKKVRAVRYSHIPTSELTGSWKLDRAFTGSFVCGEMVENSSESMNAFKNSTWTFHADNTLEFAASNPDMVKAFEHMTWSYNEENAILTLTNPNQINDKNEFIIRNTPCGLYLCLFDSGLSIEMIKI